jgi:hypothetical protein
MIEGTEKTYPIRWKCPVCGGTVLMELEEAVVSRRITKVQTYTSPNGNYSWNEDKTWE